MPTILHYPNLTRRRDKIYFAYIYIEIIMYICVARSKGKELIEYSHKDHRSVSVGITRSVWPRVRVGAKATTKGGPLGAKILGSSVPQPREQRGSRSRLDIALPDLWLRESLVSPRAPSPPRSYRVYFASSSGLRDQVPRAPCTVD